MNIQKRLITTVATRLGPAEFRVEPSALFRQLLLFDTCIIRSLRLTEIPHIAATAGFDSAKALLTSGAVQFHWNWLVIAGAFKRNEAPALPPLHFDFGQVRIANTRDFIHRCLQPFHEVAGLSHSQIVTLKKLTVSRLTEGTQQQDSLVLEQLKGHLRQNATIVKKTVDRAVSRKFGLRVIPPYAPRFEEMPGIGFRAITDLPHTVGRDLQECHEVIQGALFALAHLETRLAEMRTFCALTGFDAADSELFTAHCDFLLRQLNPAETENTFHRVVALANLPDINAATIANINIPRLLEIRETDECREFREWLSTVSEATGQEIVEQVASLNAKVATALNCPTGRVVRFLTSTGAGMIPIVGPIAGGIAGFVGSFLLERMFPKQGPISFISKRYPSIFEEH